MDEKISLPLAWHSPEYEFRPKSVDWFWAFGLIVVSLTIITFLLGNYLFGIFIIIAGIAIVYFSLHHPRDVSYEITAQGIRIDRELFPFSRIRHFWINPERPHHEQTLLIYSERLFMPEMALPLPHEVDRDALRATLKDFIPEEEIRESHSHRIFDLLGL